MVDGGDISAGLDGSHVNAYVQFSCAVLDRFLDLCDLGNSCCMSLRETYGRADSNTGITELFCRKGYR